MTNKIDFEEYLKDIHADQDIQDMPGFEGTKKQLEII